jgi:hypothetical protein
MVRGAARAAAGGIPGVLQHFRGCASLSPAISFARIGVIVGDSSAGRADCALAFNV